MRGIIRVRDATSHSGHFEAGGHKTTCGAIWISSLLHSGRN
ncbi:hypothetical protein PWR63_19245 [Paraburkholderia sp. A2WS-5]